MITVGDLVLLLNSLIWGMALGTYLVDVLPGIRRARGIARARLLVVALVVGYVAYGYIEAFRGTTDLQPRHLAGPGVGLLVLAVSAYSLIARSTTPSPSPPRKET